VVGKPDPASDGAQPVVTSHLVFVTLGSLGDLHPLLALAIEWERRGGRATLATSEFHRERVERVGIGFVPLRPEFDPTDRELARRAMDLKRGTVFLLRELTFPHVRDAYEDLAGLLERAEAEGEPVDGFVASELAFAVPVLAEARSLPWAATVLQPMALVSAYDPPVVPILSVLSRLRWLGPLLTNALIRGFERFVRSWARPVRELREELGLPSGGEYVTRAKEHADLALVLFSSVLGDRQPDWPERAVACGFPFNRESKTVALSPGLTSFLEAGEAPLVFTLGSAAVFDPGAFYIESLAAARELGRRAVLLVGEEDRSGLPSELPDTVHVEAYAPFSLLFPRAAAVVHQGGVGTTGEALRAGVPQLVVPYSHDQPDNAARVARLGVARVLARDAYGAAGAARELRALLETPSYGEAATRAAQVVRKETGLATACDALERMVY